ncbi:MAG: DUF5518 domain-containing protein [Halobacteriota archaeon]
MSRGMNALIGAAITVVLAPVVPFSALIGGGVAGYLSPDDGLVVGALSGLIAVVPLLLVFGLIGTVGLGVGLFAPVAAGLTLILFMVAFVFILGFSVVLSAIGGLLGAYIHDELED